MNMLEKVQNISFLSFGHQSQMVYELYVLCIWTHFRKI